MTGEMRDVKEGDLVELTLKPNTRVTLGAERYYEVDPERDRLDVPAKEGKTFVGYVTQRTSDAVALSYGNHDLDLNRKRASQHKTQEGIFKFNAIHSYCKLARVIGLFLDGELTHGDYRRIMEEISERKDYFTSEQAEQIAERVRVYEAAGSDTASVPYPMTRKEFVQTREFRLFEATGVTRG